MLYKDRRPLLYFLVPSFVLMIIMLYYPFIMNIVNSFFEIKGMISARGEFMGLDNYAFLFTGDPTAAIAIKNTMVIMVMTVGIQVGLALVLALMVDSIKVGKQFFQVVYFFPIVISATAIGLMFNLFYFYNGGMLNQIRAGLGLDKVLWLIDDQAASLL